MTWQQIPALCAMLAVVGLALVCWPTAAKRLAARWEARQAHARRPRSLPRPLPAATAPARELPAARAGRHRPELAGPHAVSATGIMRALNAEAEKLPAISRAVVKR